MSHGDPAGSTLCRLCPTGQVGLEHNGVGATIVPVLTSVQSRWKRPATSRLCAVCEAGVTTTTQRYTATRKASFSEAGAGRAPRPQCH